MPTLEHGAIILPELRTSFGAQAMYTCHENYTLIGNENRTCEIDGWSGKQPQCLVDWCPDPLQIAGGHVELTGKRAGATVTYQCDPGFVLIGEPVRFLFDLNFLFLLNQSKILKIKQIKNEFFPASRYYHVDWAVNGLVKLQFVDLSIVELQLDQTEAVYN